MAKIKRAIPPNAGEDARKLDQSYITGGNVKCMATLENNLAVSYKAKHATSI